MYWNNGKEVYSENFKGLIETWDVLKLGKPLEDDVWERRLIETWDVLKYEILAQLFQSIAWLIETWDVLKYLSSIPECLSILD